MPMRVFMSSGDMIADRRFDFARDLQVSGDLVAAEDLLLQTIELAPGFASAWFTIGELRESRGARDGAIEAFRQAQTSDPEDRHGAGLRLTRLGAAAPSPMPPNYLRALFDQYAPRFEAALVGDLGYRGPALLREAVLSVRAAAGLSSRFRRALDLGCGTGLAARAFAAQVDEIVGLDLSPRMAELARVSGYYCDVIVADLALGLTQQSDARFDLILAADVLIYLHDPAALFVEAARVLQPGGLLAFTVETHEGQGIVLTEGLRFAQAAGSLRDQLQQAGLAVELFESASVRHESGVPVAGLVVVATKG
uniref:Methyltransferase type 11 n=1 Tax=Rhodopseudomonas palustris (strain BisA53) TaxID=316055 RepID=Q07TQ0_RHOP5